MLAAAGVVLAVKTRRPFLGFLAVYTLALLAEYSVLPYKTPWCAVSIVYGLALLAGVGAGALASKCRRGALAAVLFAVGVSAWQASLASVPAAASPRNPWAYAQTGNGVFSIRDRVDAAAHAAPEGLGVTIDVYTRDNWWPLPWYFRRCPRVRWWREVDLHGRAASIVLLSPEMEPDLIRKLYEGPAPGERELYVNLFPEYVELRPQVEVRGYVAKSLWDRTQ